MLPAPGVSEELAPKSTYKKRNNPVTLCHLRPAFRLLYYYSLSLR
jgi:hypothetical protein